MDESLDLEDYESLLESDYEFDESDEFDEFDERSRGRPGRAPPRRPIKTPPRGNAAVKPPRQGFATKAELDATAKRLDDRIATTSTSLKTLDTRTRAAELQAAKMGDALRKEIALRKKETTDVKRGLDDLRQIAMILPLVTAGADPSDKFTQMLPFLMYSGALGGTGSGTGTGDNNNMMMIAMAIAISQ